MIFLSLALLSTILDDEHLDALAKVKKIGEQGLTVEIIGFKTAAKSKSEQAEAQSLTDITAPPDFDDDTPKSAL